LQIPKILVTNKIRNQLRTLEKTRLKNPSIQMAKEQCSSALPLVTIAPDYNTIMGLEGRTAKAYFASYFEALGWKARYPRAKTDPINVTLDIGYTILFNYIEAFVRLFGFDPYIGVYHRLWFRRKSLICDLMEPFRCLIDQQVRKAFNTGQCKTDDFLLFKNEYTLKHEKNSEYTKMFYDTLIEQKTETFRYVRDYYRCFMQKKNTPEFPQFLIT
jgi:CRISPR-associated endonuclease Cas1